MAMPGGPVEDDQGARRAAREHLVIVFGTRIWDGVLRVARPPMRARDEACGAVVGSKLVDHQDEAEERPVGRFAPNVDVELLGRGMRSQRSPEELS
jgi:hypothetical protein